MRYPVPKETHTHTHTHSLRLPLQLDLHRTDFINMVQVKTYHLSPTERIPNSPRPLIHYKNALARKQDGKCDPVEAWDMFQANGWKVAWITRYAHTQLSHFHSQAHECMAVLSGTSTIRFGVADTTDDLEANTYGSSWEEGGLELDAEAGDVFVIPSGVAHKTYNTRPRTEFKFLTPGRGHLIAPTLEESRKAVAGIELTGFTMMGAYNNGDWDFITSGGDYEKVWSVPKPQYDPVLGDSQQGLCGLWSGSNAPARDLKL